MSAIPPKADIRWSDWNIRFVPKADSCTATNSRLFDHLVGGVQQANWYAETQRLGGFEVDDKFELGGPFDRQISRAGAVKNLAHNRADAAIEVDQIRAIGHQTAAVRKGSELRYARDMTN